MKNNKLKIIMISIGLIVLIPIIYFLGIFTILLSYFSREIGLSSENEIASYVNENIDVLENMAISKINGETVLMIEGISNISSYEDRDNIVVQFETGGKGLVPESTYYGFYYSKNNLPFVFDNFDIPLEKVNNNQWKWQDNSDNHGLTTKIRENWFYFEASF